MFFSFIRFLLTFLTAHRQQAAVTSPLSLFTLTRLQSSVTLAYARETLEGHNSTLTDYHSHHLTQTTTTSTTTITKHLDFMFRWLSKRTKKQKKEEIDELSYSWTLSVEEVAERLGVNSLEYG